MAANIEQKETKVTKELWKSLSDNALEVNHVRLRQGYGGQGFQDFTDDVAEPLTTMRLDFQVSAFQLSAFVFPLPAAKAKSYV
jgi:hypothetical protein